MGLKFRIAETRDEREACFNVRFEAYLDIGYVRENQLPDRRIEDEFDDHSVIFMAKEGDTVIGTIRVTRDSKLGFPTEKVELFRPDIQRLRELVGEEGGLLFDTSRVMVLPAHQKGGALLGLSGIIYKYALKQGISDYCFAATPEDGGMYGKIGIVPLSEPKTYRDGLIDVTGVPLHWPIKDTTDRYKRLFDRPDIMV
jgi:hypothetical protein